MMITAIVHGEKGEKMPRLIDADKLRKDVLDMPNCYNGFSDTYDKAMIIDLIDEQPTVDAESVKHGRWIEPHRTYDKRAYVQCTNCGETQYLGRFMKYCPNCGAKMDEVKDGSK